jgi:hypothetical protein
MKCSTTLTHLKIHVSNFFETTSKRYAQMPRFASFIAAALQLLKLLTALLPNRLTKRGTPAHFQHQCEQTLKGRRALTATAMMPTVSLL